MDSKHCLRNQVLHDEGEDAELAIFGETLSARVNEGATEEGQTKSERHEPESPFIPFEPAARKTRADQAEGFETSPYHESLLSPFVDVAHSSGGVEPLATERLSEDAYAEHEFSLGQDEAGEGTSARPDLEAALRSQLMIPVARGDDTKIVS